MNDAEKMVIEYNASDKDVEVNRAVFEERLDLFRGNYGPTYSCFISNIYSKDGIYIGSVSDRKKDCRYFIPKKEAESNGNT